MLPRHGEKQDAPEQEGKTPHEEEAEVTGTAEDTVEREAAARARCVAGAEASTAARAREVAGAEESKADLAESAKVPFFPLLGLLGRITASSPKAICTVEPLPAAPMLSARALNILLFGMRVGAGAEAIFFTDSDEICRGAGARLWKPLAPGHCCPGPHCHHGSEGGAAEAAAAAIHGN